MEYEFIAVDIETTGTDHIYSGIYEIGAVHVRNGEVIGRFNSFISTSREVSSHILQRRKITQAQLKKSPTYETVLRDFITFIGHSPLVYHNKSFDERFLRHKTYKKLGHIIRNTSFCTLEESRYSLPELTNYQLNTLATHFGIINSNPHCALNDAEVCADIMLCLMGEQPIATLREQLDNSLPEVITATSINFD